MQLHFTSSYHPEGDGQTERTNQTLEQYLRIFCNYQQDNWSNLLLLAEFSYNNALHKSTGVSLFYANKGYDPSITVSIQKQVSSAKARDYIVDLDKLHKLLQEQIKKAQLRYQGPANSRQTPALEFSIGDKAFVCAEFFRVTRPSKKLSDKYLGPFNIIAQPGKSSFTLALPDHMRAVHPVFHVSMLKPFTPSNIPNRTLTPPPPVKIKGDMEYKIEMILDTKVNKQQCNKLIYIVKWLGYDETLTCSMRA
jgi:hypothetical protein